MQPSENALNAALMAAHVAGDKPRLAELYGQAGDRREADGQIDAACFYLTHAYVFALDAGLPVAAKLRGRLIAYGREE